VGAGPAGLTAAMYCARGGKKTLVLGNIYGSQQSMGGLYENYPGFPDGIQGIELSERMLAQAHLRVEGDLGYLHICCTVSPKNPISLGNLISCSLMIVALRPKDHQGIL